MYLNLTILLFSEDRVSAVPPSAVVTPTVTRVVEGETAVITCVARGKSKLLSCLWDHDRECVAGKYCDVIDMCE